MQRTCAIDRHQHVLHADHNSCSTDQDQQKAIFYDLMHSTYKKIADRLRLRLRLRRTDWQESQHLARCMANSLEMISTFQFSPSVPIIFMTNAKLELPAN